MGWIKENLDEIHLYPDKGELLIKDIIWAISWIGGIYTIHETTDKQSLSSAYLIFSLSLLMEFGGKIKEKQHWISRIIDGIFCLSVVSILLMAIASLFGAAVSPVHYEIMFIISFGIMIFIMIDFWITWIGPAVEPVKAMEKNENKQLDDETVLFSEKLLKGHLGDIDKGDRDNE